MADGTKIEWTEATWNPITGCSVVSPGCTHCYAMKLAGTRLRHHPSRAGLTVDGKAGPVWNGEVRFNERWLTQPLQWKRPRMIFVCAHGDLFHPSVPDEWIDRVFAVMGSAMQHTYQVLTKRPERMREYLTRCRAEAPRQPPIGMGCLGYHPFNREVLPPSNVWLGVSAERQQETDERIPHLLATPAAVRWLSAEPLLGPIDLTWIAQPDEDRDGVIDALLGCDWVDGHGRGVTYRPSRPGHDDRVMTREVVAVSAAKLDWVVVGGESGADARSMHPDWARSLRDQCAAASVPFFFKQWGEFEPAFFSRCGESGEVWRTAPDGREFWFFAECGAKSPETVKFSRVGKAKAGRLLDGRTHDGMPEVRP